MRTSRKDIKIDNRKVVCLNSSMLGHSKYTLKKGDFFTFAYEGRDGVQFAMSHGRVHPLSDPKDCRILAQVLSSNLHFSFERWVRPEWVTEIIPADKINKHLLEMFKEQEADI